VGDAGQCGAVLACGLKGVVYGANGGVFVGGRWGAGVGQRRGGVACLGGAGGFGDGLGCFRTMLLCITLPFLSRVIVLLP